MTAPTDRPRRITRGHTVPSPLAEAAAAEAITVAEVLGPIQVEAADTIVAAAAEAITEDVIDLAAREPAAATVVRPNPRSTQPKTPRKQAETRALGDPAFEKLAKQKEMGIRVVSQLQFGWPAGADFDAGRVNRKLKALVRLWKAFFSIKDLSGTSYGWDTGK
ncbi:hypothetical protein B0J13DRAFT_622788 [Dactylonectria estremocensis]|uniref:Uncharacterized protein n=1 Tax=Dactylonectria estremocensis TaxID=1079267 RepID=A0A9P9EUJ4_9HYPO|nr:hypothetical protein B0J13DRAFT_622788 [Dactylonectria estremocensis]